MKFRVTVLLLCISVFAFAQTAVRFSEPHQFFDDSKGVLTVTIMVDNIDDYTSGEPIILQVFSDLEDSGIIGVTSNQAMEKVIFPNRYIKSGEVLQFPVNREALENIRSFSLFLQKKGKNDGFEVFQNSHAVILNRSLENKSYVGISASASEAIQKTGLIRNKKVEIPFNLEAGGYYLPVAEDGAAARVSIRGIEGSESPGTFALTGAVSSHKFVVEKKDNPEVYKKVIKALNTGTPLELEILGVTHQTGQDIGIDPEKRLVRVDLKPEPADIPLKKSVRAALMDTDSLDARYSFYAGVNFDFNNNFKFEEAYYEMDVSLYNLFKNRWGLRTGIYKNNNSRSLEEKFRYEWVDNQLVEHNDTEIIYTRKTLDVVASVATESLGFYFQLPYKVLQSGNFRVFASPHIELIKRIEKYTYEVVGESTGETIIVPVSDPVISLKQAPLWLENTTRYWDSYIGVSFPMLYNSSDKGFEVFISPIVGAGYPQRGVDTVLFDVGDDSGMSFFGAFQFYLSISTNDALGIKLGSDVRKFFGSEQQPIVSVNLSTKLDLTKIMSLAGAN